MGLDGLRSLKLTYMLSFRPKPCLATLASRLLVSPVVKDAATAVEAIRAPSDALRRPRLTFLALNEISVSKSQLNRVARLRVAITLK